MKLRATITAFLSAGLCAVPAFCAEGGEGGGSWLMLLFSALNFAAFVFILVFLGGPYISKFLRDRATAIRETLSRSEADALRAQELANQAAARQARLAADKQQLVSEIRAETALEIRRMRELASSAADRIRRDAELTAAAIADNARRRIRERLAQVAAGLARELIVQHADATDQSRLVDTFVDQLRREVVRP